MFCERCGKQLTGKQQRFCSATCRNGAWKQKSDMRWVYWCTTCKGFLIPARERRAVCIRCGAKPSGDFKPVEVYIRDEAVQPSVEGQGR